MKQAVSVVLMICLLIFCSACSSQKQTGNKSVEPESTEQKIPPTEVVIMIKPIEQSVGLFFCSFLGIRTAQKVF